MICVPCRNRHHDECPEAKRAANPANNLTELSGSSWCDCQHQECPATRREAENA